MKPQFKFYEIVTVERPRQVLEHLRGLKGAILGIVEEDSTWNYAVHLYTLNKSWYLSEGELKSTDQFDQRENFYDGSRVRVLVDADTAEGSLAGNSSSNL